MQAQEQIQLAELASESRIKEQKLAGDQDSLRREEQLELARIARQRREQTENLATQRQALELEQERLHAQLAVDEDRVNAEAPVRLLRIEKERGILAEELELRHLQNQVKTLDVERDLLLPRAQQDLRREMLPLEQAHGHRRPIGKLAGADQAGDRGRAASGLDTERVGASEHDPMISCGCDSSPVGAPDSRGASDSVAASVAVAWFVHGRAC